MLLSPSPTSPQPIAFSLSFLLARSLSIFPHFSLSLSSSGYADWTLIPCSRCCESVVGQLFPIPTFVFSLFCHKYRRQMRAVKTNEMHKLPLCYTYEDAIRFLHPSHTHTHTHTHTHEHKHTHTTQTHTQHELESKTRSAVEGPNFGFKWRCHHWFGHGS